VEVRVEQKGKTEIFTIVNFGRKCFFAARRLLALSQNLSKSFFLIPLKSIHIEFAPVILAQNNFLSKSILRRNPFSHG